MTAPRSSLRVRLLVGSALGLVLAIAAFGAVAYQTSRRATLDATTARARVAVVNLAQATATSLRTQLAQVVQVAADSAVVAAFRSDTVAPDVRAALDRLTADPGQMISVALRDRQDRILVNIGATPPPEVRDSSMTTDSARYGRLRRIGTAVLFEAAAPVIDHGTIVGRIIRIRKLSGAPNAAKVLTDLLGSDGQLLFSNRDGSQWTDVSEPIDAPVTLDSASHLRNGRSFVAATHPIAGTPYQFTVAFPEDTVLAPVHRLIWSFVGIGAAIIAIGLILGWWAYSRVTRPLAELADSAEGLTRRYGDEAPPNSPRGDEYDRLMVAFKTMEATVQVAHGDLERQIGQRNDALGQLTDERRRLEEALDRLRRSEEALRQADRRKDGFLATLAHELRNPLAPIRNAVHILKLKAPGTPEMAWVHEVIDRQIVQMSRLLDDLLDVSRITHDRLELQRHWVDLGAVLRQAIETSRPLIDKGHHELIVDVPQEEIHLDGDPVRLAQVFSNLLNNSAQYTDPGGHIRLSAEVRDGHVAVSVADDGIGIAKEALPHVFERFSQVRTAQERAERAAGSGLGLGLSLVQGLVELHGGRIVAESQGLGRGSRFTVELPMTPSASAELNRSESAA